MSEVEVLQRSPAYVKLPASARDQRLPGRYRELYNQLLNQGLQEFPPIEGYETMHVMMLERAVYYFCRQKESEDQPVQTFDLKRYKVDFLAFIRSCEALLKEARAISAETAFKHNFVRQVVEVLDRAIADQDLKLYIVRELNKVAVT